MCKFNEKEIECIIEALRMASITSMQVGKMEDCKRYTDLCYRLMSEKGMISSNDEE